MRSHIQNLFRCAYVRLECTLLVVSLILRIATGRQFQSQRYKGRPWGLDTSVSPPFFVISLIPVSWANRNITRQQPFLCNALLLQPYSLRNMIIHSQINRKCFQNHCWKWKKDLFVGHAPGALIPTAQTRTRSSNAAIIPPRVRRSHK